MCGRPMLQLYVISIQYFHRVHMCLWTACMDPTLDQSCMRWCLKHSSTINKHNGTIFSFHQGLSHIVINLTYSRLVQVQESLLYWFRWSSQTILWSSCQSVSQSRWESQSGWVPWSLRHLKSRFGSHLPCQSTSGFIALSTPWRHVLQTICACMLLLMHSSIIYNSVVVTCYM